MESQGVGDTISKITHSLGIKECEPCKRRKETLNKIFPYKKQTLLSKLFRQKMNTIKVYTREGCSWCDKLKPVIEELKTEQKDIAIEVIDDTERFKANQGFRSYPAITGFDKEGKEIKTIYGFGTKEKVLSCLLPKTVSDLSVIELVAERDRSMEIVRIINEELGKRR